MLRTLIFTLFVSLVTGSLGLAGEVQRMTIDELKGRLGDEQVVILDVRRGRDWSSSEFKIEGAIRVDDNALAAARNYSQDTTFVLYCA